MSTHTIKSLVQDTLYHLALQADKAYSEVCEAHGGDRWTEGIDSFPLVKAVFNIKAQADKTLQAATKAMRKEAKS